jgi:hypothetical protein
MKFAPFGLAALLTMGLASASLAADDVVAAEQSAGSRLAFLLKPTLTNASLSVGGPNNFHARTSAKGGVIAIDLSQSGPLGDGIYHYQLTASGHEMVADRSRLDNGRATQAAAQHPAIVATSGTFHVKSGAIVVHDKSKTSRKDR